MFMCGKGTAGIVCYVLHFLLPESLSFAQQQCGGTAQDAAYRFAWLFFILLFSSGRGWMRWLDGNSNCICRFRFVQFPLI